MSASIYFPVVQVNNKMGCCRVQLMLSMSIKEINIYTENIYYGFFQLQFSTMKPLNFEYKCSFLFLYKEFSLLFNFKYFAFTELFLSFTPRTISTTSIPYTLIIKTCLFARSRYYLRNAKKESFFN